MTTSDDAHGHDGAPAHLDEEGLPDDVRAALGRTPQVDPEVRRRHLAAALAELDAVASAEEDPPVAPVLPFVRRRARILQVAAAVALVVAAAAVALTAGGNRSSDEHADSLATAKQEATPTTAAAPPKALAPATVTPAAGGAFAANDSADTAGSDAAARTQHGPAAPAPAEAATAGAPDLGTFDSVADLLRTLDVGSSGQALPNGDLAATTCAPPADVGSPTVRASATIAGARRLVFLRMTPDGAVAAVAVLDPTSCARVG